MSNSFGLNDCGKCSRTRSSATPNSLTYRHRRSVAKWVSYRPARASQDSAGKINNGKFYLRRSHAGLVVVHFCITILIPFARIFRDFDADAASLNGSIDNVERGSLASFGSGTTTDSDNHNKVGRFQDLPFLYDIDCRLPFFIILWDPDKLPMDYSFLTKILILTVILIWIWQKIVARWPLGHAVTVIAITRPLSHEQKLVVSDFQWSTAAVLSLY